MADKIVIGYVGTKDLKDLKEKDIRCLDIINLAFGLISGGLVTWDDCGNLPYIEEARKINPSLKFVLSIGGWGAGGFSEMAATADGRKRFAQSAAALVQQVNLDGIDIDWEYPCVGIAGIEASDQDKENFTHLLRTLREELDTITERHCLLTIAAGGGSYYIRCTNMRKVQSYLDYVMLMTYDLRGGFSVQTGHHTNLYTGTDDLTASSADHTVRMFLKAGVPKEKLIIGAAYYSRMWKGVPNRNNGYMQMAETTGGYGPDYGLLEREYINKNGYTRYWDEEAKAPTLFNGNTFISYEDKESLRYKAEYVKEQELRGMMFWEYKCDSTGLLTEWIANQLK